MWGQSKVPEDWRKAIIVPFYKGKGNREEYNNYRSISMYGRILTERLMEVTGESE